MARKRKTPVTTTPNQEPPKQPQQPKAPNQHGTGAVGGPGPYISPINEPSSEQIELVNKDLNILNGQISEYLKTFIVLGYTLDGIPVQIVYAKNRQDLDSLNMTLHRFVTFNSIRAVPPPDVVSEEDPH